MKNIKKNYRKHIPGTVLLIFLLILIASCKTLPSPSDSDDTLLIIPMGIESSGHAEWFGKYRIHITDSSTGEDVKLHTMPLSSGYTLIKGLKPGKYYISSDEFIYNSNRSPGTQNKRSIYFELHPGKITVLNSKFIYIYSGKDSGHMNRRWQNFTSMEQIRLLDSLNEYKNFDLWIAE